MQKVKGLKKYAQIILQVIFAETDPAEFSHKTKMLQKGKID